MVPLCISVSKQYVLFVLSLQVTFEFMEEVSLQVTFEFMEEVVCVSWASYFSLN